MTARLALLLSLSLPACRRESAPPRAAPSRPPDARSAPSAPASPAPDAPPAPRRAEFAVLERTPWAELAPGARWAKATVRLTPAPDRAHPDAAPRTLAWVVARLDVARVELSVERTPGDRLEPHAERTRDAVLVTDSGFFEPDYAPSGVVLSCGRPVHGPGPRGGSGVLALTAAGAAVVAVDTRDGGTFEHDGGVTTAVQCGPRVVEAGGAPGVFRHDGRFAARTVACVRDGGRTLDVIATWDTDDGLLGPELYDLATVLAGPSPVGDAVGCEAALNLDGGPSTGIFLRAVGAGGAMAFGRAPMRPTPWAIVARLRAERGATR